MPTKIIIEAEVDTGNSAKEVMELDKSIDAVVDSSKGLTAVESRFDTLNKKVESGEMSMRDMAKAVKEYQTIALQAGQDSPIGQAAIQKAAELSDELGDLNAKVKNLGNDGRNMQAALQLGGVVVSGYTAFQSVLAMVGSENEDLLKIITKLQAAQGALAAIEQVRAALEKESFLMLKLKNIQLAIQEQGYKKLFIQLLKNPYVAIGAAIVGIIGFMSALLSRESEYEKAIRKSKEATEALIESTDRRTKLAIRGIDDLIASLKAEGKETFEQEQEKQKLIIRTTHAKVEALKQTRELERTMHEQAIAEMEALGGVNEVWAEKMRMDMTDKDSDIYKSQKKLTDQIRDLAGQNHQALQDFKNNDLEHDKAINDKKQDDYKEYIDKKKAADRKYFDDMYAAAQKQMEFELRMSGEEVDAYVAKLAKEQKELDAFNERNRTELKRDTDALIQSQNDIVENEMISFDRRKEALDRLHDNRLIKEEEFTARMKELKQQEIDNAIMITELGVSAITSMQQSIFEITNNLGKQDDKNKLERAKRQFNITKAVNIAEAAIDGAKAVTKAIAQFGPPPSPLGIAGIISAGAITGLQIAAIASRKFDGGGAGNAPSVPQTSTGGGDGGEGGNTRGQNFQTGTGQFLNPQGEIPVAVLEVENVNKKQKLLSQIETLSTL